MTDIKCVAKSDEQLAEEFGKLVGLMRMVFNKPAFSTRMAEASAKGLSWMASLEYASFACPDPLPAYPMS